MADATMIGAKAESTTKRAPKEKFEVPDEWIPRGFTFAVEWPEAASKVRSHFDARRFAYNWAFDQVKADLDANKADPAHESAHWNLCARCKWFNAERPAIALSWDENSKEAYSTEIADLCVAWKNFSDSMTGRRKGRAAGFRRPSPTKPDSDHAASVLVKDASSCIGDSIGDVYEMEPWSRSLLHQMFHSNTSRCASSLVERWGVSLDPREALFQESH